MTVSNNRGAGGAVGKPRGGGAFSKPSGGGAFGKPVKNEEKKHFTEKNGMDRLGKYI
jgi:hypothetical protein